LAAQRGKLEVGVRDLGVDNLSEYVNPLEGLLDSFNHAGYVVPGDSCNRGVTFAVERSQHDLDLLLDHAPTFSGAVVDGPICGVDGCGVVPDTDLLLLVDRSQSSFVGLRCIVKPRPAPS
jgi:hypothetical protein